MLLAVLLCLSPPAFALGGGRAVDSHARFNAAVKTLPWQRRTRSHFAQEASFAAADGTRSYFLQSVVLHDVAVNADAVEGLVGVACPGWASANLTSTLPITFSFTSVAAASAAGLQAGGLVLGDARWGCIVPGSGLTGFAIELSPDTRTVGDTVVALCRAVDLYDAIAEHNVTHFRVRSRRARVRPV